MPDSWLTKYHDTLVEMALYLVAYVLPALFVIAAVPMALGKVPPNRVFGFRTPKTLSSPEIWYPANRIAGWWMIAAGVAAVCLNLVVWRTHPDSSPAALVGVMAGLTGAILIATLLSFVYLRKLPANRN
jgi:hypothetical protein